ncbi:MAG: ATP-binding cassette domain-containing protein, partial [Polyangiaceae bacterium]|nr:ATP-binding cassette domain-containing protein [Polyangiaceae bacterium]
MIYISQLGKRFGPKELFSDVSLQLNPGQRYGLVGANGSGKSTFMKILIGDEASDEGELSFGKELRFGVLRQDQFLADEERIVDVAMQGDQEVYNALQKMDNLGEEVDPQEVHELSEIIAHNDGYTLEARAKEILLGLGIPEGQLEKPLSVLSGGYKLRVLLAQVLVGRPDALLLDEPTNHLDIQSKEVLKSALKNYEGTFIVVSHDREFLEGLTNRIWDIEDQT